MLDILLSKIVEILVGMGYKGIFLASLGLFPSEVVIALFSSKPEANIWLISLVASTGAVIGSTPTYFIGYLFTEDTLYRWLNGKGKFLRIDTENINKSQQMLRKNAFFYILITRVIPWLRIVTSIGAGYVRAGVLVHSLATFIGIYAYTLLISVIGIEAGSNWELIKEYLHITDKSTMALGIALLLSFFLYKGKRKIMTEVRTKL